MDEWSTSSDSDSYTSDTDEGYTVITSNGKTCTIPGGRGKVVIGNQLQNIQLIQGDITVISTSVRDNSRNSYHSATHHHHLRELGHPRWHFSDSTARPCKEDMDHVCRNIGKKWRNLGYALGLSRGMVEAIEIDYRVDGLYEMAWQTLQKWQRSCGNYDARICTLVQALAEIGMEELASQIPVK